MMLVLTKLILDFLKGGALLNKGATYRQHKLTEAAQAAQAARLLLSAVTTRALTPARLANPYLLITA